MDYMPEPRWSTSILDCPVEIFHAIFALDTSPADLASLCCASKSVNALAQPLLYSKIEWEWLEAARPPPITLLLGTLVRRPDLAAHVQHLVLRGETFIFSHRKKKSPPLPAGHRGLSDDDIASAIRKIIPTTDVDDDDDTNLADDWLSAARAGRMDAFVALLLVHLPRLARLVLETNFARDMDMIGRAVLAHRSFFQHLRSVDVFARHDWAVSPTHIDNTDAALSLFYLPCVAHMRVTIGSSPRSTFRWPAPFPPDPRHLTSLELLDIREPHLGEVLRATTKTCGGGGGGGGNGLRSLAWTWYKSADVPHTSHVADLDAVCAALAEVGETLVALDISADTDEGCGGGDDGGGADVPRLEFHGGMEGLRARMGCLERLRAPLVFLLGPAGDEASRRRRRRRLEDVMPAAVRHVTLTHELGMSDCTVNGDHAWGDEDQFDRIVAWLRVSGLVTPRLRRLDLEDGSIWAPSGWDASMRERLRRIGDEVGVQVEYTHLSTSY